MEGGYLAEVEARRLADVVEGLGSSMARHFEDEVVPPVSPLGAGSYSATTPPVIRGLLAMVGDADVEGGASPPPNA